MGYSVEPVQVKALSELLVVGKQVIEGAGKVIMTVRPVIEEVVHASRPPVRGRSV
jgi:hypothetical protein